MSLLDGWRAIVRRLAYGGRPRRTRPYFTDAVYYRERARWREPDVKPRTARNIEGGKSADERRSGDGQQQGR